MSESMTDDRCNRCDIERCVTNPHDECECDGSVTREVKWEWEEWTTVVHAVSSINESVNDIVNAGCRMNRIQFIDSCIRQHHHHDAWYRTMQCVRLYSDYWRWRQRYRWQRWWRRRQCDSDDDRSQHDIYWSIDVDCIVVHPSSVINHIHCECDNWSSMMRWMTMTTIDDEWIDLYRSIIIIAIICSYHHHYHYHHCICHDDAI